MSFWSYVNSVVFLLYSYLIIFILLKNPKALINRVCAAALACHALWSFGYIFIFNSNVSKEITKLIMHITSIGWIFFASFTLWFAILAAENKKILEKKIIYLFIFLPPIFLIFKQWTNFLVVDFTEEVYGWSAVWSRTIWPFIFYTYYLAYTSAGLYLMLDFRERSSEPTKKSLGMTLFVTTIIPLIFGTLTDLLLPELNINKVPSVANIMSLLWGFGLLYLLKRYKFMTPAYLSG